MNNIWSQNYSHIPRANQPHPRVYEKLNGTGVIFIGKKSLEHLNSLWDLTLINPSESYLALTDNALSGVVFRKYRDPLAHRMMNYHDKCMLTGYTETDNLDSYLKKTPHEKSQDYGLAAPFVFCFIYEWIDGSLEKTIDLVSNLMNLHKTIKSRQLLIVDPSGLIDKTKIDSVTSLSLIQNSIDFNIIKLPRVGKVWENISLIFERPSFTSKFWGHPNNQKPTRIAIIINASYVEWLGSFIKNTNVVDIFVCYEPTVKIKGLATSLDGIEYIFASPSSPYEALALQGALTKTWDHLKCNIIMCLPNVFLPSDNILPKEYIKCSSIEQVFPYLHPCMKTQLQISLLEKLYRDINTGHVPVYQNPIQKVQDTPKVLAPVPRYSEPICTPPASPITPEIQKNEIILISEDVETSKKNESSIVISSENPPQDLTKEGTNPVVPQKEPEKLVIVEENNNTEPAQDVKDKVATEPPKDAMEIVTKEPEPVASIEKVEPPQIEPVVPEKLPVRVTVPVVQSDLELDATQKEKLVEEPKEKPIEQVPANAQEVKVAEKPVEPQIQEVVNPPTVVVPVAKKETKKRRRAESTAYYDFLPSAAKKRQPAQQTVVRYNERYELRPRQAKQYVDGN